jgi:hypothetical protein
MAFLYQVLVPSSSSVKVFWIIIVIFLYHNVAETTQPRNETTPAVFTLGDSILDTGNNDYIISITKSDFPPYGRDFMGGRPTGRFSNGRVPSDFIGKLNSKEYILVVSNMFGSTYINSTTIATILICCLILITCAN